MGSLTPDIRGPPPPPCLMRREASAAGAAIFLPDRLTTAATPGSRWPSCCLEAAPVSCARRRNGFLHPCLCPGSLGRGKVRQSPQPAPHAPSLRTEAVLRDPSDCQLVGNGPRRQHVASPQGLISLCFCPVACGHLPVCFDLLPRLPPM